MNKNVLYALVAIVSVSLFLLFNGIFKDDEQEANSPVIKTYKQIAINALEDLSQEEILTQYINSNLKPTQKMLDETSVCIKNRMLDEIVNSEEEVIQVYLASELEVFNSDDELNVFTAILDEFDDSYKKIQSECSIKHIDQKYDAKNLICKLDETITFKSIVDELVASETLKKTREVLIEFSDFDGNINLYARNNSSDNDNHINIFNNFECSTLTAITNERIMCINNSDESDFLEIDRVTGNISYFVTQKIQDQTKTIEANNGLCEVVETVKKF